MPRVAVEWLESYNRRRNASGLLQLQHIFTADAKVVFPKTGSGKPPELRYEARLPNGSYQFSWHFASGEKGGRVLVFLDGGGRCYILKAE